MIVQQTGTFKRQTKKLHKAEKSALDKAIKQIIKDPSVGEMKVGDLAGIQIFKYKLKANLYLLAYEYLDSRLLLTLISHGSHEHFYR
ncbi:MAG: addiction module toxin RelE [Piscirickettsiaceae bacterium]|nr:MAG: addiction module toxin RelE [Piscirickettsiaceae bacterium]